MARLSSQFTYLGEGYSSPAPYFIALDLIPNLTYSFFIINTGQTKLADSAQGTALFQMKKYITDIIS